MFNLENNITIEYTDRQTRRGVDGFRCFAPVTDRLLFYSNEIEETGLQYIDENFVKPANPFRDVLKNARIAAGMSTIQVAEHGKFYGKVNHGGSVANWESGDNIPTVEQWQTLSQILNFGCAYDELKQMYDNLRLQHSALREEHEHKRRYFNNEFKLLDVMKFGQEAHISKNYKHDTPKPEKLSRAIILTTTRPGDLVVVPFAGSGTECAMAEKEGRPWVGYDIEAEYVDMTNNRAAEHRKKPTLF